MLLLCPAFVKYIVLSFRMKKNLIQSQKIVQQRLPAIIRVTLAVSSISERASDMKGEAGVCGWREDGRK